MIRKRLFVAALIVMVGACSTTSAHPSRSPTTSAAAIAAGDHASVTAPGGGAVALPDAASSFPAAPSASADPATAARQSFDAWLLALGHDDTATLLAHSTAAASALASLQVVTDRLISASGGSATTQVTNENLTTAAVNTAAVTFHGAVDLRHAISGPKGNTSTTDHITGPITVANDAGVWKVTTFTYDGAPMVYFPEGATQTNSGIHLNVAFLLTTGNTTTGLVGVFADKPGVTVTLESDILTATSGAPQRGRALFAHGPTGMLLFPQVAGRPTRLEVTVQPHTTAATTGPPVQFSIALAGRPS